MPARYPVDVDRLIVEATNSRDLEAAMAMSGDEAVASNERGEVSSGIEHLA